MANDDKKRFTIPKWVKTAGKVVAVAGLAVVAGMVAISTTNEDKDEDILPEDEYVPFVRAKKEFYSDFELADFCRGGDLTEN